MIYLKIEVSLPFIFKCVFIFIYCTMYLKTVLFQRQKGIKWHAWYIVLLTGNMWMMPLINLA